MNKQSKCFKLFIFCLGIFASGLIYATNIHPKQIEADFIIQKIYHKISNEPSSGLADKLELISKHFLDTKYLLGPLGEGINARFDQEPLYRIDAFDCETYVNSMLALALANNLIEFKNYIKKLRYANGQISFINRNHFTELDWNTNNQKQFLQDITPAFKDQNNKLVALMAKALINKSGWYAMLPIDKIKLNAQNFLPTDLPREQKIRWQELKEKGKLLPQKISILPYIPFTALFLQDDSINDYLLKQIPHGAIIEIVRPNWQTKEKIGTNLNISHMGLVFWKNDILYFREASSIARKVIDIPLDEYLRNIKKNPSIKGINIQILSKSKI